MPIRVSIIERGRLGEPSLPPSADVQLHDVRYGRLGEASLPRSLPGIRTSFLGRRRGQQTFATIWLKPPKLRRPRVAGGLLFLLRTTGFGGLCLAGRLEAFLKYLHEIDDIRRAVGGRFLTRHFLSACLDLLMD